MAFSGLVPEELNQGLCRFVVLADFLRLVLAFEHEHKTGSYDIQLVCRQLVNHLVAPPEHLCNDLIKDVAQKEVFLISLAVQKVSQQPDDLNVVIFLEETGRKLG